MNQIFAFRTRSLLGILFLVFMGFHAQAQLATPPIAHWRFDETEGTTAKDISGNGHDGTLVNNPIWTVDGRLKGALSFDGTDDYVDAGNFNVSGNAISIAAWVKFNNLDFDDPRIVAKEQSTPYKAYFSLDTENSTAEYKFRVTTGAPTATIQGGSIHVGEWDFVVGVYDGSTMKLYVNGIEVTSATNTGDLDTSSTVPVYIGSTRDYSRFVDGTIDEVRIYNYALTEGQIDSVYKSAPIAYWRLNETAGDTAFNATGNKAYDGVLSNGPVWSVTEGVNGALHFDGEDDGVNIPYILDPSAGSFSVSMWANTEQIDTNQEVLQQSNDDYGYVGRAWLRIENDLFTTYLPAPNKPNHFYSTTHIIAGTWYHVAVVVDNAAPSIEMYVNGVLEDSSPYVPALCEGALIFGQHKPAAGSGDVFKGLIDEVMIFNTALTEEQIVYLATESSLSTAVSETRSSGDKLMQSYPNPFKDNTTITYSLLKSAKVSIDVYNITGQKIRTLVNAKKQAGSYIVTWDGHNDLGQSEKSGMYFCIMRANDIMVQSHKMLLAK